MDELSEKATVALRREIAARVAAPAAQNGTMEPAPRVHAAVKETLRCLDRAQRQDPFEKVDWEN